MDNIDVNVDHYTIDELLEIADLTYLASDEEVVNVFTQYINKYIRDKDFKLAQFFHDAKEKIFPSPEKVCLYFFNTDRRYEIISNTLCFLCVYHSNLLSFDIA